MIIFNLALLTIEKYLPWYDLISNTVIKRRMNAINLFHQNQTRQIEQERRKMTLTARVIIQSSRLSMDDDRK